MPMEGGDEPAGSNESTLQTQETGEIETPNAPSINGDQLSFVGANLESFPVDLGDQHGPSIKLLDLSYNELV